MSNELDSIDLTDKSSPRDELESSGPFAFPPIEVAPLSRERAAEGTRTRLDAAPPIPNAEPSRAWLAKLEALAAADSGPAAKPAAPARTTLPPPSPSRSNLPPPRRSTQMIPAATPPPVLTRGTPPPTPTAPPPRSSRALGTQPPPIPAITQQLSPPPIPVAARPAPRDVAPRALPLVPAAPEVPSWFDEHYSVPAQRLDERDLEFDVDVEHDHEGPTPLPPPAPELDDEPAHVVAAPPVLDDWSLAHAAAPPVLDALDAIDEPAHEPAAVLETIAPAAAPGLAMLAVAAETRAEHDWFGEQLEPDPIDRTSDATEYFEKPRKPRMALPTALAIGAAALVLIVAFFALRGDSTKAHTSIKDDSPLPTIAPPAATPAAADLAAAAPAPAAPAAQPVAPQPVAPQPVAPQPAPQHVASAPQHVASAAPAPHPAARHVEAAPAPTRPAHHASVPATVHHAVAAAATAGNGILMISTKPPCEIIVDGRDMHLLTPQRALPLSPGAHKITLINAQQKIRHDVAVKIDAQHPTKLIQNYLK